MKNTQNENNQSDNKFLTEKEIYVNNKSDIKSLTEQERNDKFVAWHDVDINACRWLTLKNVKPKEAAMLLCRLNPLEDKNPELIFEDADESSPNRYLFLLREFEDMASLSDIHRTLKQWRQIAKDVNLSCHPWIDDYMKAIQADNLGFKPLKESKMQVDEKLAALFDPVTIENLSQMFPAMKANGVCKWKGWQDKASSNGLITARTSRAKFNPYLAGMWFSSRKISGWDMGRINRKLASNLPARSFDEKYQLTGDIS